MVLGLMMTFTTIVGSGFCGSRAKKDYAALNTAFLKLSPSVDPGSDSAIEDLVILLQDAGFDVVPFFDPKFDGDVTDKFCTSDKVYDALVYHTSKKKWNPFLCPRKDLSPDDSLGYPNGEDFVDEPVVSSAPDSSDDRKRGGSVLSRKRKEKSKKKNNSTSGFKSSGNVNADFLKLSKTINPSDGDAIIQLANKLKAAGYNCKPYGEPKLGGTPIDKIVVDGKVYDALVYFSGTKRWNPGLVYMPEKGGQ